MSDSRPCLPEVEPIYDPRFIGSLLSSFIFSNMSPSRPFPSILPIYNNPIPNCPGKSIVALQVTFPPNGSTPPHSHAGAFLSANIVSGYVLNKKNDDPMEIFGPGETFKENPGCRHRISDNASATEPAVLVATLFVDTKVVDEGGVDGLVVIDEEYRSIILEARERYPAEEGGNV
jgi:quercetin dioxygenase-like cupin family protein